MERKPIAGMVKPSAENFAGAVYLTAVFNGDGTFPPRHRPGRHPSAARDASAS
jgi:hypothetical protein